MGVNCAWEAGEEAGEVEIAQDPIKSSTNQRGWSVNNHQRGEGRKKYTRINGCSGRGGRAGGGGGVAGGGGGGGGGPQNDNIIKNGREGGDMQQ